MNHTFNMRMLVKKCHRKGRKYMHLSLSHCSQLGPPTMHGVEVLERVGLILSSLPQLSHISVIWTSSVECITMGHAAASSPCVILLPHHFSLCWISLLPITPWLHHHPSCCNPITTSHIAVSSPCITLQTHHHVIC